MIDVKRALAIARQPAADRTASALVGKHLAIASLSAYEVEQVATTDGA